jgi:hypothetical protein
MRATYYGHAAMVKRLLDAGANGKTTGSSTGMSVLHKARGC